MRKRTKKQIAADEAESFIEAIADWSIYCKAENAILREALEHYAADETWFEDEFGRDFYTGHSATAKGYDLAREVLDR